MKNLIYLFLFFSFPLLLKAQSWNRKDQLTLQDSLQGSITTEREWWDLLHYELTIEPSFVSKTIKGHNVITYKVLEKDLSTSMQIDLQEPLKIDSVSFNGSIKANFSNSGMFWYLSLPEQKNNSINTVTVYYSGKPHEAIMPPWDGGWIWTRDKLGRPWMTIASQGIGASIWFPCKDHQSDEPERGISFSIVVPDTMVAVANGRLVEEKKNDNQTSTYTWLVSNPINNYAISPYIGSYAPIKETYQGVKGTLEMGFWVLDYNYQRAKTHLVPEAKKMMKSFEHWFGPYPFYEDGYKLVDSPFGMEHQSAIAYGNDYQMGFRGRDYSGTGWGMQWDFLLIHESAHEWFGNSITAKDPADKWIHESFACYADILYMIDQIGENAANEYVIGTRKNIRNDEPIIGPYEIGKEGSSDMYHKGRNMLHMIRAIINDDKKFRDVLLEINQKFYHQTITTQQIETLINDASGIDFTKVFDQYLRTTQIPTLEYKIKDGVLEYRYANCIDNFSMPLRIGTGKSGWINPSTTWKKRSIQNDQNSIKVGNEFYINTRNLSDSF